MKLSSKVMLGVAMTCFLALGVLALSARTQPRVQEAPSGDGDPIILKGGSLTLQCPKGELCMIYNPTTMKFEHKDKLKKVAKIVVKDESGNVLFSATSPSFPNGKPSVEIFYK
ncbi:MAG: hypothetical protein QOD75_2331 [Blastocatellia bacterium]|jgi:hypothetical protein|nr:hypothetical protein [Blastocatellia bacterium]